MPAPRTTNSKSREYLQEAYENYQRYEKSLDQQEYLNWAIVFLFYSAVHLINAYAIAKHPNKQFHSHQERDEYVKDNLRVIYNRYDILEGASRNARYELVRYGRNRALQIHNNAFNGIRVELKTLGFEWEVGDIPPNTQP